jgi:hypothetical protein
MNDWNGREATEKDHKMPESFKAFCNIVSLTAANTRRIFVVSVACVKLLRGQLSLPYSLSWTYWPEEGTYCGYRFRCARLTWLNLHRRYLAARFTSLPPE